MDLFDLLVISLRTLAKNKLRSSLTVLGVVIGIAAVMTMVSIGQGAGLLVRMQFENLGSNVLVVFPASNQSGGRRRHNPLITTNERKAMRPRCDPEMDRMCTVPVAMKASRTSGFRYPESPTMIPR